MVTKQQMRKLKVLLIDDDPAFGAIMRAAASTWHVHLDFFTSLEDLGRIGRMANYDLIVCDFFLEFFNGGEIARYVQTFFNKTPMVIISARSEEELQREKWPSCVRGFVCKRERPDIILTSALTLGGFVPFMSTENRQDTAGDQTKDSRSP